MEEWFAAGKLTEDEMQTMLQLVARFVYWNVDQFEHFAMATPDGPMYVDFNQAGRTPYAPDAYLPAWPRWSGTGPKWTVWREDDNGNRVEMVAFGSPEPAEALAAAYEARGHKQRYWIERP